MKSKCTLEIKTYSDPVGDIMIRVEQHPVNPLTVQRGFMVGIGKKLEFMTEFGSNSDDASISILTASCRF